MPRNSMHAAYLLSAVRGFNEAEARMPRNCLRLLK